MVVRPTMKSRLKYNKSLSPGVVGIAYKLIYKLNSSVVKFTLNPLLLRSRGVDEEGSQSLTLVILRPMSQILVNVTLKLVDACAASCGHRYIRIR